MKKRRALSLLGTLLLLALFAYSHAEVEMDVKKTFEVKKTPLDVAISVKGRWIFVLTHQGELMIYSPDGTLKDTISVGKTIDRVRSGPVDDVLLLSSTKDKTVQVITLDFVQKINVAGSPFKGPVDAPVVIAVFDDFE